MGVAFEGAQGHIRGMRTGVPSEDKTTESGGSPERGYAAWKRRKIEAALEQAKDRPAMIPADKLLRDLGIER